MPSLLDCLQPRTIKPRNARKVELMPVQLPARKYAILTDEQRKAYHRAKMRRYREEGREFAVKKKRGKRA